MRVSQISVVVQVYSLLAPAHLDPLEIVVTLVVGEAVGPLSLRAQVPIEAEALSPASPVILITEAITQPPQSWLLTADLLKASETVHGLLLLTDHPPLHHDGHRVSEVSLRIPLN